MALAGIYFQVSDQVKLDRTVQEVWHTEVMTVEYSVLDSIGNRSRVLRVKVRNPVNVVEVVYRPMRRVRLIDEFGLIIFLGRIVAIEPDYTNQLVVLTCRDFLDDLSDRTITAAGSDGNYAGITHSRIVELILQNETYAPTYFGLEHQLVHRIGVESSSYTEYINREYGQKSDFQTITSNVPGNYLYRGVKTGIEAINDLSQEDAQQDLVGFYYTPTPTDPTSSNHINYPVTYPRTYWTDLTHEIHGEKGGATYFITPQTAQDTTTPESADILYFGSNSKFDGIRYAFLEYGAKIASGTYAGNIQWQYWNGTAWTGFTPTADAKLGVDSGKIYGTTYWTVPTDWIKRDLGTTPDMHTANDATQNWPAPFAASGTTLPEDVNSLGISKVDHGDERRGTTRYWVRVYVRTGSITTGYISTVELYTKPNLFHDFRCEDPEFLSEIWKYTHNATTGREGHGGTWLALNMTGGNAGTGSRLLWDTRNETTDFIGGATDTWYFGSEKPFNGLSFHAFQGTIPDYSNVKFVWQWYSNYFGSLGESWQTISGLTITGNTVANPTVITTERHHLDTGDSVIISGSNSTPTINGTHTVTVISATTFSIPINVTTAGTAGHVVCNNHITATEAMSGSGNAAWTEDRGIVDQQLFHWNLDVRWDIDEVLANIARPTSSYTTIPEYDTIHLMDDYPYRDLISLDSARVNKQGTAFGINSATVANPTVLTTSSSAGGTTANHNMQTGDQIFLTSTNSTPSLDGIHTVTRISATTVSIPVTVTSVGNTGTASAVTRAPNEKYLYWVRCYITTGTPTQVASLRSVQTANVGTFRYFDRGSEPWVSNISSTVNGSVAITPIPYCYRYDNSASAGSKFTDYSSEIQSSTSATSFGIIENTVANPTVIRIIGVPSTISGNTVATNTVITTSSAHGLSSGSEILITGSNSTPAINGLFIVEVLSTTTFSIVVTVTSAGTAGTVSPLKVHDLSTGHKVVITNSNSTPSINGTHTITVLSLTTFSIAVNVTTAGTAGTVVPEKVTALDGGQVNDAIYFGNDEPFTHLRLNISDVLTSAVSNISSVQWEYYRGESTDDWTALTHIDYMYDFKTSGTNSLIFDMPESWRTVQPGIKEANATDQSFGKTSYYIRARISSITGSPSGTAKLIQGFIGPNLWHPNLEVGTLANVTSKRQSDPLTYGLTLTERAERGAQRMPIIAYEIKDHSFDFVNRVGVRGQAGAYGVVEDADSVTTYGIVKERIVDDSSLVTSIQCEDRARSILETLKPTSVSTIRECRIRVPTIPIYAYLGKPAVVRAGDLVNVNIATASIRNEKWFVYSLACQMVDDGWSCEVVLFRDLTKIFEPGPADRRLLRDLVTKSRETANAVFQPLDKAVVGGLDFLPEGPGRYVGREEYRAVGTDNTTVDSSNVANDWTNEFRWTKRLYLNHKGKEFVTPLGGSDGFSLDLMRIDHHGVSPAFDEVSKGGAGLTLISRDGNTANRYGTSLATSNFHPGNNEATLYLKKSATNTQGTGLYLAHRNIFNSGTTYNEWAGPGGDTDQIQAEIMTGFTGFVDHNTLDANGRFTIILPALDSAPLVFASICGHEGISGTPGNYTNAACNIHRWTTVGSKYTAVQMQVVNYPNNKYTDSGNYTITAISAANPTVITTTSSMPNGRAIWIGESNSTPTIDGLYHVSNKAGSSPYTYTLTAVANSSFSVNVTGAGTAGKIMSMQHGHEFDQAGYYDYSDNAPAIGVMYMVVFNSGKNTSGLNSHFSQNHTDHG